MDHDGHVPRVQENPASRTLWLGDIQPVHTEEALTVYFERFGKLDSIRVLHAKNIAFVNFLNVPDAMRAKEAVSQEPICGVHVQHNFAKSAAVTPGPQGKISLGDNEIPSNIVWIGGLVIPPLTETFLNELFAGFPGLINVVVYEEKKIAFVNFQSIQHATLARNSIIGKPLGGIPVKVCFGKPPNSSNQARAMGIGDSSTTTAYQVKQLQQPVDYYEGVDLPDALSPQEVEELLDHMRGLHPEQPQKLTDMVSWAMVRSHSVRDIIHLLDIRSLDNYMNDAGKRLQFLYFFFELLRHAKTDEPELLNSLIHNPKLYDVVKTLCWNQPASSCAHITQVFAAGHEMGILTDQVFIDMNSLIKSPEELDQFKTAYGLNKGPPQTFGGGDYGRDHYGGGGGGEYGRGPPPRDSYGRDGGRPSYGGRDGRGRDSYGGGGYRGGGGPRRYEDDDEYRYKRRDTRHDRDRGSRRY